jgi:hypothetical protein
LTDVESGESLDLVLDARTLVAYLERLGRLGRAREESARRAAGRFLSVDARESLEEICRTRLAREGVLVPA